MHRCGWLTVIPRFSETLQPSGCPLASITVAAGHDCSHSIIIDAVSSALLDDAILMQILNYYHHLVLSSGVGFSGFLHGEIGVNCRGEAVHCTV